MLSRVIVALAATSLVAAQTVPGTTVTNPTGYGRFGCTDQFGNGDQSLCNYDDLLLRNPGANDPNAADKGDTLVPNGATCFQQVFSPTGESGYYCGIAGAACTADIECDNGGCDLASGTCQGGFNNLCNDAEGNPVDTACSGLLYCSGADSAATVSGQCGGIGAFCNDFTAPTTDDAVTNAEITAQYCFSGYCNQGTVQCDTRKLLNEDCTSDPDFACVDGLVCVPQSATVSTCQLAPSVVPEARSRSRSRRALREARSLCPASHSACSVDGSKTGFECVDTLSNLEQCGACASAGGVDCTALPGVEAVGCVAGVCEIWSCAEGFSWDAASSSCMA